jgi:hypothetical protein
MVKSKTVKLGSTLFTSPLTATATAPISKRSAPANFSFIALKSSAFLAKSRKREAALSFPSRDI